MKRSALAVIAMLAASGCSTFKGIPSETVIRDSVVFHVRDSINFRDSVVLVPIPAESSSSVMPEDDSSHLETSVAFSDAWIRDGLLHHTLRNRDALVPYVIKIPEHWHLEAGTRSHDRLATRTVYVEKKLSRMQSFWINFGKTSMLVILAALALFLKKRFL